MKIVMNRTTFGASAIVTAIALIEIRDRNVTAHLRVEKILHQNEILFT